MSAFRVGILTSLVAIGFTLQNAGQFASNHSQRMFGSEGMRLVAKEKPAVASDIVDAWLMVHFYSQLTDLTNLNMYSSLLNTVKEGLEAGGAAARIIGSPYMDEMISNIKGAVAQGRRPLVVTVAHDWVESRNATFRKLREAKECGAYLVQYNSEPAGNQSNSAGHLAHLDKILHWAKEMGADEVWDYSIVQVQHYPQRKNGPIIRYVPPGYTQFMDVGVNMNSDLAQTSVISYLGAYKKKTCSMEYRKVLGGALHHEDKVWTLDDLHTYMEKYPLQLNQHRSQTCLPREKWEDEFQHFESFRMSHVLANKACVISPPSAISEMELWKEIVIFAEVENTLSVMQSFAQDPRKLLDCRTRAYNAYRSEFNGKVLLQNAGFWHAWHP